MSDPAHALLNADGTAIHVMDVDNKPVPITALWSKHTAIILFVRHFLCTECQDYFRAAWHAYTTIYKPSNPATITPPPHFIVIGCGSPRLAQSLAIDLGAYAHPYFHIYTDQQRTAYRALGLVWGGRWGGCWACVRGSGLALWQGVTRCWCVWESGDVKQNGGEFVLEGGTGRCLLAHIDQTPGGHASVDDVLKAAGMVKK